MRLHNTVLLVLGMLASLAMPAIAQVPAPPAATSAPTLSDAEVAHAAVTANGIDIDLARLAEKQGSDRAVLEFARTMIRDHQAVNARAGALAQELGVTPAANAVSQSLLDGAAETTAKLRPLTGADFDRAYMAREVAYHEAVLDALDTLLIPETENARLKALLEEVRPAFVAHLEHARQIRAALSR